MSNIDLFSLADMLGCVAIALPNFDKIVQKVSGVLLALDIWNYCSREEGLTT